MAGNPCMGGVLASSEPLPPIALNSQGPPASTEAADTMEMPDASSSAILVVPGRHWVNLLVRWLHTRKERISLYDLLGVSPYVTTEEIKRAWSEYKKNVKNHPDGTMDVGDKKRRDTMWKEVEQAHDILINADARLAYNRTLIDCKIVIENLYAEVPTSKGKSPIFKLMYEHREGWRIETKSAADFVAILKSKNGNFDVAPEDDIHRSLVWWGMELFTCSHFQRIAPATNRTVAVFPKEGQVLVALKGVPSPEDFTTIFDAIAKVIAQHSKVIRALCDKLKNPVIPEEVCTGSGKMGFVEFLERSKLVQEPGQDERIFCVDRVMDLPARAMADNYLAERVKQVLQSAHFLSQLKETSQCNVATALFYEAGADPGPGSSFLAYVGAAGEIYVLRAAVAAYLDQLVQGHTPQPLMNIYRYLNLNRAQLCTWHHNQIQHTTFQQGGVLPQEGQTSPVQGGLAEEVSIWLGGLPDWATLQALHVGVDFFMMWPTGSVVSGYPHPNICQKPGQFSSFAFLNIHNRQLATVVIQRCHGRDLLGCGHPTSVNWAQPSKRQREEAEARKRQEGEQMRLAKLKEEEAQRQAEDLAKRRREEADAKRVQETIREAQAVAKQQQEEALRQAEQQKEEAEASRTQETIREAEATTKQQHEQQQQQQEAQRQTEAPEKRQGQEIQKTRLQPGAAAKKQKEELRQQKEEEAATERQEEAEEAPTKSSDKDQASSRPTAPSPEAPAEVQAVTPPWREATCLPPAPPPPPAAAPVPPVEPSPTTALHEEPMSMEDSKELFSPAATVIADSETTPATAPATTRKRKVDHACFLFVDNIPAKLSDKKFQELLRHAGPVHDMVIWRAPVGVDGGEYRDAWVQFVDKAHTEKARHLLHNKRLKVDNVPALTAFSARVQDRAENVLDLDDLAFSD